MKFRLFLAALLAATVTSVGSQLAFASPPTNAGTRHACEQISAHQPDVLGLVPLPCEE
jgi:hypothetical protein